jgi:hypothetical protein
MIRVLGAIFVCLGLANGARAATLDGVTFPDTYPLAGETLVLNGIGVRTMTIFNVKVYVAGLYLKRKSQDPQAIMASPEPKVVLLQFLHSGSKADIEREYRDGEKTNCGDGSCPAADAADFDRLVAVSDAVKVGDTSTFIITNKGMRVYANQKMIAEFANPDLGRRILAGFIGAHPPTPTLRDHLLGQSLD